MWLLTQHKTNPSPSASVLVCTGWILWLLWRQGVATSGFLSNCGCRARALVQGPRSKWKHSFAPKWQHQACHCRVEWEAGELEPSSSNCHLPQNASAGRLEEIWADTSPVDSQVFQKFLFCAYLFLAPLQPTFIGLMSASGMYVLIYPGSLILGWSLGMHLFRS